MYGDLVVGVWRGGEGNGRVCLTSMNNMSLGVVGWSKHLHD